MRIDNEVFERLRDLVARHVGCKPEQVTAEARLSQDLGIDGNNAVKFLEAFGREFSVEMSGGPLPENLHPESWLWLFPLVAVLLLVLAFVPGFAVRWLILLSLGLIAVWACYDSHRRDRPGTLRIRDLLAAARAGNWLTQDHG